MRDLRLALKCQPKQRKIEHHTGEGKQRMRRRTFKRHTASTVLVVFLLVMIASTLMCIKTDAVETQSNSFVDLFTQRGGQGESQSSDMFGPQETVQLYAKVGSDGEPQVGVLVTFQIVEPTPVLNGSAFYRTAETNASGMAEIEFSLHAMGQNEAFGTWMAIATAEVAGEILRDLLTFKVDYTVELLSVRTVDENPPNSSGPPPDRHSFGETGWVGVEIALRNNMMSLTYANIAVSLVDELRVTVNYTEIDDLILPPFRKIVYIFRNIGLPKHTAPGNGTVYVDAFNRESVSLCPQISTSVVITIPNPVFPNFKDDSVVYADVIPTVVEPGGEMNASVIVGNEGTVTLDSISVTMYVNNSMISNQIIQSMDPFKYQFFSVVWNSSGFPEGNYTFSAKATVFLGEADLTDNNYTVPFEVIAPSHFIHDVAVLSVQPQSQTIFVGQELPVLVTVANEGSSTETFNVTLYYDSNPIQKVTVYSLPPTNEQTLAFLWDTSKIEPGNYTLSAFAEPVPEETNLPNNMLIDGVVTLLLPPPLFIHDVAIIRVTASPSVAYVGDNIKVTVKAANLGSYTETFNVTAYYNDSIIFIREVTSLLPNQTTIIESTWNTSSVEAGTYSVRGEAEVVPGEVDVGNNVLIDGQVTLLSRPPQRYAIFCLLILMFFLILAASAVLFMFMVIPFYLRRRRKKKAARHSYVIIAHPHI